MLKGYINVTANNNLRILNLLINTLNFKFKKFRQITENVPGRKKRNRERVFKAKFGVKLAERNKAVYVIYKKKKKKIFGQDVNIDYHQLNTPAQGNIFVFGC